MKVLIADDEPLARARLAALLGECDGVELVGSTADGESALEACAREHPEVLVLDIHMPGLDGLGLARRLQSLNKPPQVIFCTAYEAHALEAYDVSAADFLLKPVRLERLRQALERAEALRQGGDEAPQEMLIARVGGELRRIPFSEVCYFLAEEKYVAAHMGQGSVLLESSLKTLEEQHPALLRVHRNCLVPRERMIGLKRLADGRVLVRIAGSDFMPEVSRRNLPALRKLLREE